MLSHQLREKYLSEIVETLNAAAKRLRLGEKGEVNADRLEAIAQAMNAPHGYIVMVGGVAYRHDLCRSSAQDTSNAAIASGLTPDLFTVEPFFVLRR